MTRTLTLSALIVALAPVAATASSDEAWAEFRAQVDAACRALVVDEATVDVEVNAFGSEHYGAAIVSATSAAGTDRMICVYDKAAKTAELTAPFTPADATVPAN